MNDFNITLKEARAKQRWMFAYLAIGLIVIAIGVFSGFVFTNGTAINVLPQEATMSRQIEVHQGFGFTIGDAVYAIADEPVIRVSAAGYKPEERKVTFQEKGGHITVTLHPRPGRLIASTTPQDPSTSWWIDGRATAISPMLEQDLDAGEYALMVDSPHFLPDTKQIKITRAQQTTVAFDLVPVSGQMHIEATPDDAQISINGMAVDHAPLDLEKPGGVYEVEISHPEYITVTDTIDLTNKKPTASRNYRLNRKTAILHFKVSPAGGHLLLDGSKVDPEAAATITSKVEHQLTYLKPGYFAQTRTVTVNPDLQETVTFNLKPEMGAVEIKARPSATVFIDGKESGATPLSIRLSAVPHKISLHKPGYRTVSKTITPQSKGPMLVDVTLMTELAARLAEAPKEYKNSAGIILALFQPTQFVMGAPRHEKGQRANEFLRTVKLEKPFYAAHSEVTNAQFAKFKSGHSSGGSVNAPAVSMSWEDAALFCNWLSTKEGLKPFYVITNGSLTSVNRKSDGYRLLTEAEWEWLARRAGRNQQTTFPWGDTSVIPPMAGNIADESAQGSSNFFVPNYNDGYAEIAPVMSFPREVSGLFDLTGNVSEWVHDYYSLVPPAVGAVEIDPLGEDYGDSHVIKGSNWRSGTRTELRASYREGLMQPRDDLGFRVGRYLYGGDDYAQTQ